MIKKILKKNNWILIPIIILSIILIIRLIDNAKLMFFFPFDFHNDISAYMAMLHFLKECGFHNFCPYWFNGFTAFNFTTPGWFFFALPLYYLFGDVKVAAYVSTIISFVAAFFIINYFLKDETSLKRRILFYLLIFANAVAIGNFIRLGRVHILLGWALFLVLYLYLIKKINSQISIGGIISLSIVTAALILIHYVLPLFILIVFLSYFIITKYKGKIKIIIIGILSFILSSFWLIPFLKNINQSTIPSFSQGKVIITGFKEIGILNNLMLILVPIALILLYYIYQRQAPKKEKIFFIPTIIIAILFLVKLTAFIPFFDLISHDHYIIFFIINIAYFLIKIDYNKINIKISSLLKIGIILFVICSVLVTIFYTPWFTIPNDEVNTNINKLLPNVNGTFFAYFTGEPAYTKAYDSYIPIYYNQSSVLGWYYEETTQEYFNKVTALRNSLKEKNCNDFLKITEELNVTNYLGYDYQCQFVEEQCNQTNIIYSEKACLIYIN